MAAKRLGKTKKQRNVLFIAAQERGVRQVRRRLHPSSYEFMDSVTEKIIDRIDDDGNVIKPRSMMTTMVGFSRYSKHHCRHAPPTKEIIAGVDSIHEPLTATLGRLGLFGSDRGRRKLAFRLNLGGVMNEIRDMEEAFKEERYPLGADPNALLSGVIPHCTVGFVYLNRAPSYEVNNERKLRTLDIELGVMGKTITFRPVNLPDPYSATGTIDTHGR